MPFQRATHGVIFFPERADTIEKGSENKNSRVASPESNGVCIKLYQSLHLPKAEKGVHKCSMVSEKSIKMKAKTKIPPHGYTN